MSSETGKPATDWQSFVDNLLHASHALPNELWGPFFHDWLEIAFGQIPHGQSERLNSHATLMEYGGLLSQPPVTWGVGDALLQTSSFYIQVNYILPTNTALDSSSKLVGRAKQLFGWSPFIELKTHNSAALGEVIRTASEGAPAILHLVCRLPGNPSSRSLGKCFQQIPTPPWVRHVLPFWGVWDELDEWADAIAGWANMTRSNQEGRPRLLIKVMPENQGIGLELEKRLLRRGVPVLRESGFGIDYETAGDPPGLLDVGCIARSVSPGGPLTPPMFAKLMMDGLRLPWRAWRYFEDYFVHKAEE